LFKRSVLQKRKLDHARLKL